MNHNLARLLDQHGPILHALLWRITLRHDAADDLLQELFVKLLDAPSFPAAANPLAYLKRAAINLALDHRRAAGRTPTRPLDPAFDAPHHHPSPADALADAEQLERILSAAAQLGDLSRQAFILRYVQQDSFESIAAALDRSPHQARALCHHAVRQLRHQLNPPAPAVPATAPSRPEVPDHA